MLEKKEVLEKKLKAVNKQINGDIITIIIAILFLVFVPIVKFENFVFKIDISVIIIFIALVVCIVRRFSLQSKKEDIEAELSVYQKEEIREVKKEVKKEPEPEFICAYCDKKFKSEEALNKHYETCEEKKYRIGKYKKIAIWGISILIFLGLGIYFFINNKINLIPLFLIGFILTPIFNKLFNCYKKRSNRLKHFEFYCWKKTIVIFVIILIFILINWLIPECPKSCNDNNSCTNDFCSAETGYKCMNPLKLNCKGNGICESGEYGTSDCPNCDDSNKCTVDTYDVVAKKCLNVKMKGCIE